jgi:hypothetical protein
VGGFQFDCDQLVLASVIPAARKSIPLAVYTSVQYAELCNIFAAGTTVQFISLNADRRCRSEAKACLVTNNRDLKVCDLEKALTVETSLGLKRQVVTLYHRTPEILLSVH